MEKYTVCVSKDYLGFAAAHFIVFDNDLCERLHGHNYRVAAEIEDELRSDWLVFDFIELKRILKSITDELDHRMLVPLASSTLQVEHDELRVRITKTEPEQGVPDKEWILPRGDCALLAIENTTAELLARWFTRRLRDTLVERCGHAPKRIRLEVHESPGQRATYETDEL